ncbi:MAG TPA: ornithine carbamoyltransferase, partial [Rhizomicrobium sp.]
MTGTSSPRHFIDIADLDTATLESIIKEACRRKRARTGLPHGAPDADAPLAGRVLALIFDRHSTRTRISFDVAMRQLGGTTIMMSGAEMQLAREETIADTARVLSRYLDAVMIRLLDHEMVRDLADNADIPVVNGLTKISHPCQVMADVMTFEERKGPIRGRTIAWTGDANNVLASWIHAAARLGFRLRIATPKELSPHEEL